MFEKIKSIVKNLLGIEKFESKDGKVVFTEDQQNKIAEQFGEDFIEKFTATLEKELADTTAKDQAESLQATIDSIKAENAKKMQEMELKLSDQAKKIEILSKQAEDDIPFPEVNENGGKMPFKINPKHAHNKWAQAMMTGGIAAEVMAAGDTIDVDDLKTEFGTYLSQHGDGQKEVIRKLTQPTESMKYMTTKVAITEWRATDALITSVVQQFSAKWTPLGASKFTPITIKNRRHKINVPITPDEINDSWLSHLYDEQLTPEQMPITKYIINQLILPKVEEDRELKLIANGVFTEFGAPPATGDAGQTTGLSMDGFITQLVSLYEDKDNNNINFIALGPVNSSNIVDKVEEFVDNITPLYRRKPMNVFTSDTRYKTYKRGYRDLFPTTKNEDNSDKIDYSVQTLTPLPSMAEFNHFFTTPKENFIRLVHKNQGASRIFMQGVDYDVKVFAEWWEACGFAIEEAVFAYIDALQVIQGYATNSDASNLKAYMLTDAGCTDVDEGNLADYKVAIAAEASIADLAALQTIIDTVNGA